MKSLKNGNNISTDADKHHIYWHYTKKIAGEYYGCFNASQTRNIFISIG